MSDFNTKLIEQLRSGNGEITSGPMAGRALLVLATTGARSGQPREAVLTYTGVGDDYLVAATAGGSPTEPAWFHNLVAKPEVRVEAKGRAFPARAAVVDEAERQQLWTVHVAAHPEFAEYPEKARRVIPMVRLKPLAAN